MLESEFTTEFGRWLTENKPESTEFYEFKVTNGGTFNLKKWRSTQPHQPRSLKQINSKIGVYHKISDGSMGQKPLDAFFARDEISLLVIWFDKWKEFFMIPINKVPNTDSISYKYCTEHFKSIQLLLKKEPPVYDF